MVSIKQKGTVSPNTEVVKYFKCNSKGKQGKDKKGDNELSVMQVLLDCISPKNRSREKNFRVDQLFGLGYKKFQLEKGQNEREGRNTYQVWIKVGLPLWMTKGA